MQETYNMTTLLLSACAFLPVARDTAAAALPLLRVIARSNGMCMVDIKDIKLTSRDDDDDDEFSDEETESLFNFDNTGAAKPGALKPHLRAMREKVSAGDALLLDARPSAEYKEKSRPDALHCPLADFGGGAVPAVLATVESAATIFVFAAFDDAKTADAVSDALKAAGYTDVRTLEESFEALQAQLPAS